jgi:glutamine amidotransferase
MNRIAVIDSGVANLASVMAALNRLGAEAEITSHAEIIRSADRVILPGVGSAAAAMAQLRAKNLIEIVRSLMQPVLGICLGMQLLFTRSEENGGTDGLGILPGTVRLLRACPMTPVPHMGWNQLALRHPQHPLLRGIDDDGFAYFVHSYAVPESDIALATTDYGENISSIVAFRNFYGCQFHPERSGSLGSQILKNFMGI